MSACQHHRRSVPGRRGRLAALAAFTVLASGALTGVAPAAFAAGDGRPFNDALDHAAESYDVPRDLLAAVGYGESRLDGHDGQPSQANGFGVMHLVSNPDQRTLEEAARLTGRSPAELRGDTGSNLLGGAAVLRARADALGLSAAERDDIDAWYGAVAKYSGAEAGTARLYADTVYRFLADGLHTSVDGEQVEVAARDVAPEIPEAPEVGPAAVSQDYPSARWVPAAAGNFASGRSAAISQVVVHVTQGSYAGSISWFQNPTAQVSAHYVIRSSDGEVTQMVKDADTAYHARSANASSLGIEHEGFVDDPAWFTEAMYRSSAALTAYLCEQYGIPKDRSHIVGHVEVPGNDHTDPGPNWDWAHYMELVGGESGAVDELTFASYATQLSGSSGPQVKAVQRLLTDLEYTPGAVDGAFGSATQAAVRAFQQDKGLEADGIVGKATWTALLSAGSTPTLRSGSSGEAVSRLQRALTAASGKTVAVDGSFGSGTAEAVRAYQSARSLEADGVVGAATWKALQSGR
ncbi:peptidoglycan recognition protein family protein [Streptomyces albidoflavus]|uniref:peptidoglycan recognition protein family protein n=1 Tax=Streptomyces albidoflavus TaxID=1886 RepID=UPI00331C66B8